MAQPLDIMHSLFCKFEICLAFNYCIVRHVQGICDRLAEIVKKIHGLDINPLTDIAICCGQTEAFAAAVFASKIHIIQSV